MHINLESDYAIRLVHQLAKAGDRRVDGPSLAEDACVPLRFTLKIMRKLGSAALVRSFKGAHGGYTLARPAEEITLRQVIEAVEGPYMFSRCLEEGYTCTCSDPGACTYHKVYDRITRMVVEELDKVNFGL